MPIGAFKLNSIGRSLAPSGPSYGPFTFLRTLDNPNPYTGSGSDNFGYSVGISDTHTIVGAFNEDDASGLNAGKAYIYSNSTGSLLYTLDDPNPVGTSANDFFGCSCDISGSYAIVGAYNEADANTGSGKAYIYSTSTGSLLYTLNNPNAYGTSATDNFGFSVAISGSYAIVGAYNEDDAGGLASGKAYIYSTSTGSLLYTLNNPNPVSTSANDSFAYSVGITDSYAIVGAWQEDETGGTNNNSGRAYIYSTSTGSLLYTLVNPSAYATALNDNFGWSVAICESYSIVGAYNEDDVSGSASGKAYIFSNSTGSLLYTLNNPNPYGTTASDFFSYAVDICESYAIVGAHQEDEAAGTQSGKAYIYSTTDGSLLYTLNNPNAYSTVASDGFGRVVAISNLYAIAGANAEDDAVGLNQGKAYVYTRVI